MLDDAIREHLELKRRRGADPGEIAREEQEALEPVFGDEPASEAAVDEAALEALPGEVTVPAEEVPAAGEGETSAPQPGEHEPVQETAEIDMEAVLDHEVTAVEDAPGQERLSLE
jgi:hypothetical protein